ncbi:MAG: hypothetical protein Q8J64_00220, partial [Thermodesulfovibrionales bacterium]|nr:hypothetical protein [Thermodesulfovibrionales bacterium]
MAEERHLNIDGRQPDKKQAVVAGGAKKGRKMPLIAAALIAAAFAGAVIFSGGKGGFTVVEAADGVVKIPVSTVGDGHAKYFSYGRTGINFFVLRSSDGAVRVA